MGSQQEQRPQTEDAKHEDEIQYGTVGITQEELEEK